MVSRGNPTPLYTKEDVLNITTEANILNRYFGISKVPILINSPIRKDVSASFGIYSPNGIDINYKDFATGDKGTIFTLLKLVWGKSIYEVYRKIIEDLGCGGKGGTIDITSNKVKVKSIKENRESRNLQVKVRKWKQHDIDYWGGYGIDIPTLEKAEVYPISHIIIEKDFSQCAFPADKWAYVYIERKEGKITKKTYQPFNKNGFKWRQDNDKSVIALWRLLPSEGERVVICSSLKDSLTLTCNCNIPAINPQGEGYTISKTAMNQLKKRFKKIYVLFDADEAGIKDAEALCADTGFINIPLPKLPYGKDISDYRESMTREEFCQFIYNLIEKNDISN